MATVLVDAENVRRSRWPNIPAGELVDLVCAWAERGGHRAVVCFDGEAPGGEREVSATCVAAGSGGETADEWLVRAAAALAERGEVYWLVTSDRALRQVAGARAERVVGGGSFARELGGG